LPEVADVVGIKFDSSGKVYGFKSDGLELKKGELVVVESDLGISIGRVIALDYGVGSPGRQLRPVLRRATSEDLRQDDENRELKLEAHDFCKERIMARGLPMKLVSTEVTLDRKRIIFYFVAETRIDFRELVKDLAARFRTRIELRQIGVRDEAKIVGGLGICGRDLCCRSFLTSFAPISIKMAKQQELVLNTCKLSGVCGRLMCCLGYEFGKEPPAEGRAAAEPEEKPVEAREPAEAPKAAVEAAGPGAGQAEPAEQKKHFRKPRKRRWRRKKKQ
jgi:cell fate regulator YaaT (PSP1 superfamily)